MFQSEFNFDGPTLRDAGMQMATDHADAVHERWSEKAYDFLKQKFLPEYKRFMTEDLRAYAAIHDFPLPPSARAWGGEVIRVAKENLIIKIKIQPVKNAKAHCANAAVWERNDEKLFNL